MISLTFGEQVKIVLSRKGMTIKDLAEQIEAKTGRKMSRQNLTQRLGRDNFQEQDMRMIADILGCSFQLSILATVEAAERASVIEEVPPTSRELSRLAAKKEMKAARAEAKEEAERDLTVGEFVDMMASAGGAEEAFVPEEMWGAEAAGPADEGEQPYVESGETQEAKEQSEDSEVTVQEVTTADTEIEAIENDLPETEAQEETAKQEMDDRESTQESEEADEYVKDSSDSDGNEAEAGISIEPADDTKVTQETVNELQNDDAAQKENEPQVKEAAQELEKKESKFARITRIISTPKRKEQPKDFQPIKKRADEDEDLVNGDVNPYTGHEYQTNSVRMHPKRIGYVQVYDRKEHKWTDMTEWAFLGYEERKKATQGKDYEPPIYLD